MSDTKPENILAEPTANLFAALAKAAAAAGAVGKDAVNAHHRYKYASAESILEEARGPLHANGLALVPLSAAIVSDGQVLDLAWLLTHASGERLAVTRQWPVVVGNGRPADKAVAAAATTALAYVLRDLLLLPRVDEEVDRREDKPDSRPAPKRAPKGPAPKAPPKAAPVEEREPGADEDHGPPPGAEADDLRDQARHLMERVPAEKRVVCEKALRAAGDNLERLRAGVKFMRDLVDGPKAKP